MSLRTPFALPLLATAVVISHPALADAPCSGHLLLPQPRQQGSCQNLKPGIFTSSDKKTIAAVFAADKSLNATPDMRAMSQSTPPAALRLRPRTIPRPEGPTAIMSSTPNGRQIRSFSLTA